MTRFQLGLVMRVLVRRKSFQGKAKGEKLEMRIRNSIATVLFGVLAASVSWGQNNCGGSPAYGTCAAPAPPLQIWCAGNNAGSTCPGGTSWVGFDTTAPGAGSWSGQFEGIDAAAIIASGRTPGAQADPNGGVGPTNSSGVGQYLEFADDFVQAFDKKTGNGIFSNQSNGVASPQPINSLFAPGASKYCINPSLDGIARYDRLDGVFFLGNIFQSSGTYYFCTGVSAPDSGVPASNLQGSGGRNLWNVYVYSLNPAIPKNANGVAYFPDYVRFGAWSDGFYIAFDLEDISKSYDIVGFEVCQLDKVSMIAGLSSKPPQCYTYIPNYVVGTTGTAKSLIHTVLPADFEGANPIPATTAGEYFLALVNPSNFGTNNQCTISPCTSNQLAFWTWSGLVSGAGPTYLVTKYHPFTPGCYNTKAPYNTYCVPEPYGGVIDGLGDRLAYRLAYQSTGTGEVLAVAHTVQEQSTTKRTGIRLYKIKAGTSPSFAFIIDIQDTTNDYFLSMPSVAMDAFGDVGVTYTVTGNSSHGSVSNYDPSPYFVTVNSNGVVNTPVPILSNSGITGEDETDEFWGEYVSVSADPDDNLTFWAANQYMNGDQTSNCSYKLHLGTGCTWASRIFTCQKGLGC